MQFFRRGPDSTEATWKKRNTLESNFNMKLMKTGCEEGRQMGQTFNGVF
jgi:hypothetical protein